MGYESSFNAHLFKDNYVISYDYHLHLYSNAYI